VGRETIYKDMVPFNLQQKWISRDSDVEGGIDPNLCE
jgi:hypothetical protein